MPNLTDCYVTNVLSLPYPNYGQWWVNVEYDSYGRLATSSRMFATREEAEQVHVGHYFTA